jgi:hypothetical protein
MAPWTAPTTATTSKQDSGQSTGANAHSFSDRQLFFTDAESVDQQVFAEMRSSLLLVSGEHYQKRENNFYRRIRDAKDLSQEQKLRLTKNHTRKICQIYSNNIMAMTPGVGFTPKDENSNHDQKVAEMHHSVWRDAFDRYGIDDLMDDWCDNFVQMGEVAVKIFFDPMRGRLKGHEQAVDAEGNPAFDEMGQPVLDETKPVYAGEFIFDEIYGFNLLRPVECKDLRKAEWLCIRKMVNRNDLLRGAPEDKKNLFTASHDETYMVFDAASGGYYRSKNQVLVKEFYFRPCPQYPKGYFYYDTKEGCYAEGELPGGVFPIAVQCFDKIQTTPRGRSPVKQMRPYQAEVNRTASKIAEHQITLGDDKLLIQNGTKVSASASLPGIRAFSYTGAAPTVLDGRSGAQYLDYMNSQITEMYAVMNVQEDTQEKEGMQLDPYVLLFRSARQKKKFQRYIKRYEKFLVDIVKIYLSLAKFHLSDDEIIWAIGKSEQINIAEFKQLADICYEVKVEAQADDIETKLGKQIVLNHALQYIGPKLKDEDIGKIMRAMPFGNFEQSFDDMTIDYDSTQNDILALDRGEQPPVNQNDSHVYCIKRLTSRMRKSDFKFLGDEIKANYEAKIQLHQQFQTAIAAALQRAEQGFIPTSGYLTACDLYVSDPSDPTGVKSRRVRVPSDAVSWLIKQLETQGVMVQQMEGLPEGAQAQMADMLSGGSTSSMAPAPTMRASMPGAAPAPRPAMGNSPMPMHKGMGSLG